MTIRVMPGECLLRSYLLTVFMNLRITELQQTRPWVATQGGSQFTRLKRFNKWLILNSYNHTRAITRNGLKPLSFHYSNFKPSGVACSSPV